MQVNIFNLLENHFTMIFVTLSLYNTLAESILLIKINLIILNKFVLN